ncbi:hypothetical protein [Asticcacaulis sp.]|uniref:hypothetical protein n=1 Tax=Asticcacaulis sp. TaxID=1872648 RepID=UPI002608C1DF|nr:hypothetical protein [Asticcacaulis sp.]
MRSLLSHVALSCVALSIGFPSYAASGKELAALSAVQQTDYIGRVIDAVAQSFQQTDGATVRSNCVNRWYQRDKSAANRDLLASAVSYPNEDPVRVVMAMMIKLCGRDKDEGMQKLRERVAQKLEAAERASDQALADAEGNLKAIEARAWRLPDGRRIYQSGDGTWRFENGAVVPPELAKTRVAPK